MMVDDRAFRTDVENQWCPGCPNFAILTALRQALTTLGVKPEEICLVSGIGQAAKLPHYITCNFFNGLHGRALPIAVAISIVNPELTTIVTTGDGDCYGEGGNHFLHTIRRNPNITLMVHNNQIYGLTKGQGSPTTEVGEKTRLQFDGVGIRPLNPLAVALMHNCQFVARGFTGNIPHLSQLMVEAIRFRGFSYLDIIQPCITWGTHSIEWYKERVYVLPAEHDNSDRALAMEKANEWGEAIPTGVLYRAEKRDKIFGEDFRKSIFPGKLTELGFPPMQRIDTLLSGSD